MKNKLFSGLAVMALVFSVLGAPSAHAYYEGDANQYFVDAGKKLGRGITNIVSSPAGLFCSVSEKQDEGDNAVAGFFVGLGKGLTTVGNRLLTGAFETVTFFLPSEGTLNPVCT